LIQAEGRVESTITQHRHYGASFFSLVLSRLKGIQFNFDDAGDKSRAHHNPFIHNVVLEGAIKLSNKLTTMKALAWVLWELYDPRGRRHALFITVSI